MSCQHLSFSFLILVFILDKIYTEQKELIMLAVKPWLMIFKKDAEEKENRRLTSEYKIEAEHRDAVQRKSQKATITIYGAIRRKDIGSVANNIPPSNPFSPYLLRGK